MMTEKNSLNMPSGFWSLFLTQLLSAINFAVMYATLILYIKQQLHMSSQEADLITGVYFACNFSLHLLSGYLGGRFFSYRGLVTLGLLFQFIGSVILGEGSHHLLYWGLSCVLIGTGTMVTCLNMLVSQLFSTAETQKRQTGFLWNYSGMNMGFILGFTLAGYYQLQMQYNVLFMLTAIINVFAMIVLLLRWQYVADKDTIYSHATRSSRCPRLIIGCFIVVILIPVLHWMLSHTNFSDHLVLAIGVIVAVFLLWVIFRHHGGERNKFLVFYILLLSAQIFWILYQLAPMGLMIFAKNNVDLHIMNFRIAPGWIPNINSITIIFGAPLLGLLFVWLHSKMQSPLLPFQYSVGLMLSGLGLLILPIGIMFAHNGYTALGWLVATYFLLAIAELFINPIGYSMVGQLVPIRWQSLCMGSLLLNSGVAAVLASVFSSDVLRKSESSNPLITNPYYAHSFHLLGLTALGVGVLLFLLRPLLNRLINEKNK